MVPHITKITADHHTVSILRLSANTEHLLVNNLDLLKLALIDLLLVQHPPLKVLNGPYLKNGLSEYFPNSGYLFE